MPTIHFSVPTTDPEAFAAEWAEFNQAVEDSTPPEEPEGVDHCEEWDKFWSRFDFPFEGGI